MKMLDENYCGECDEIVHSLVDEDDFYGFKVGLIRCPNCGKIVHPCNSCRDEETGTHYNCGEDCSLCPWKDAKVVDALTDSEYMLWCRDNNPAVYEMFKGNDNGDYYHKVIAEIENGEKTA